IRPFKWEVNLTGDTGSKTETGLFLQGRGPTAKNSLNTRRCTPCSNPHCIHRRISTVRAAISHTLTKDRTRALSIAKKYQNHGPILTQEVRCLTGWFDP